MNKIFKVIWSDARSAYVVVSEIAKNHGSKSCSTKKLLTMLLATGVMTCASVAPVMAAANLAPNDTKIEVGKDAKAKGSEGVAIGKNSEASASGYATAIGGDAKATGSKSTVVGNYSKATEAGTISIGYGNLSSGANAITIGHEAIAAGMNSFAFGSEAKANKQSSIAFGSNSVSDALGAIAIGNSAQALGTNSIAIGCQAIASKEYSVVIGAHTNQTGTGSNVTAVGQQTEVLGNHSTAVGMAAKANFERATAIGSYANALAAGSVALGAGSTASREAGVQGYDPLTGNKPANTSFAWKSTKGAVSVGAVGVTRQIINVAAGSEDTDAVNVAQLKQVNSKADSATETANRGWTLSTNNVVAQATKVAPGANVDFSGDDNITVSKEGTNVTTTLNKDLKGIESISNGPSKVVLNEGYASMAYGNTNVVLMNNGVYLNGKVNVDKAGQIHNVTAGTADEDAVNVSQLHAVQQEAGKHTKVVNGSNITVEETDQDGQKTYKVGLNKDILLGDITGKNVSISGTNGTIETTGYIATKDRVYADKGAKLADVDITGDTISNDKSSVKLDKEGTVTVNNKVTIDGNGKVSGVAAGEISNTSTDAVNGSQLKKTNDRVTNVENNVKNIQGDITNIKGDITNIKGDITTIKGDVTILGDRVTKVEQEAGKHTKVVNGSNVTVEETDQDGQKTYKVGLNKDLLLGDITGKNVSISGTNGTIETTGSIATKDKIYADKGAKLADIDITGDTISNGQSSVKLDKEGTVTINGKVSVNQNGKVSGVAAGDISATSTDAVNGGQLYETNQAIANNATNISSLSHSISNLDNRVNKVGAGAAALAALHPLDFDPDAKWDFAAGYGNYRGANAAAVGAYYRPNEDTMFSVGGTFGNGENMVNAGVSFKLGSGSSHVSTSRVAMAKEIKELRGELEAMKSAMLDANAGKKIDTSKLQLFPDVPQNHWAYEYVAQLAGNGMIEGYPNGNFAGDRPMTRYEFAAILYRAMTKGAVLSDKILSEFSHELEYFTVDTIAKDKAGNPTIQRVRTVKENKNK